MNKKSVFLILLFSLFSTTGQYLYKVGAASLDFNIRAAITNYPIIAGLFFYITAAILLLYALKGAELSIIYPFIGLGYVWVAFVAFFFFGEKLLLLNWLGIGFIVLGVSLVGYGAEHD